MQHNCPMEKVCSSSFKSSHEKDVNIVYIFLPSKRKKKKVTLPKLKLILFKFRILLETFSVVCSFKILLWGNYTIGLV